MRFSFVLPMPLAALAQTPAPNAPVVIPPPLRQAVTLVNDYGNLHRYAADNATVKPPAPGEQVTLSAPAEDIHVFDADDRRVSTRA